MNSSHYISVSGPSAEKMNEAVQAMSNLYVDVDYARGIEVYKSKDRFIINFKMLPDFERFKYFVNYLHYPEVDDYRAEVRGYWTLDRSDDLNEKHPGKRVMLYVSPLDKDGDNVNGVIAEGTETYKLGFSSGEEYVPLNNLEIPYEEDVPDADAFELLSIIDPNPRAVVDSAVPVSGKGCLVTLILIIAMGWAAMA